MKERGRDLGIWGFLMCELGAGIYGSNPLISQSRPWFLLVCVLAVVGVCAAPALAQGEVEADMTATGGTITVGDPITMTVTVRHPAGQQVLLPRLEPAWGAFEVRSQPRFEPAAALPTEGDNWVTSRMAFVVTLFAPGDFRTPELALVLSDSQGNTISHTIHPLTITVTSVLTAEDRALRDLKPQAAMVVPPLWPWLLLGLVAPALLFLAGRRLWHRWRRPKGAEAEAAVDSRPAYVVAYAELDRIQAMALPEAGRIKAHYTLVGDCLRRYLEGQFGVRAMDRTTAEIRAGLRSSPVAVEPARLFVRLFEESDLVKFAKFRPTVEAADAVLAGARDLVDRTRPQPEETVTGGAPGSGPTSTSGSAGQAAHLEPRRDPTDTGRRGGGQ